MNGLLKLQGHLAAPAAALTTPNVSPEEAARIGATAAATAEKQVRKARNVPILQLDVAEKRKAITTLIHANIHSFVDKFELGLFGADVNLDRF